MLRSFTTLISTSQNKQQYPCAYRLRNYSCFLWVARHRERDYFLVHRGQFLTKFYKRGLDTRPRHYISSFAKVIDRILPQKFTSIRFIVSGDHTWTRYLRGLCGRKYRQKRPCRSEKRLVFGALRARGPVDECRVLKRVQTPNIDRDIIRFHLRTFSRKCIFLIIINDLVDCHDPWHFVD